ncbi:hypothetical protein AKJ56_00775 [candidate division MSBL1 archaeon SCGC-AAA382N08]|uniref:Uncharacterized protein n=1 Tax=candidate division MSBL1 archaeon SCGC-AAA382N08 TaxID=1698285 RepID=A0A133VQ99_9EURY|nr:hypothetical protein AKJ56_00775 [candidate division MSBL1 archaeon SCGC-AAA382N08]
MIILGIDPGTTRIGYGLIEKEGGKITFKDAGIIEINNSDPGAKLLKLEEEILNLLSQMKPEKAGVEKLFFSKNKKTALEVAEARGVIITAITKKNIPLVEILPNEVKISVTGNGNTSKEGVSKMVSYILKIPTEKYIDDTTDALAVAIATGDKC